jgi:DNA-binding MarR family transcriptional regulator
MAEQEITVKIPIPNEAKGPLSELYSRPGFLMRRADQIATGIAMQECAALGLTPPQHSFLVALDHCPGLDQRGLGKMLGIDRVTAGQLLRGLEVRGLIQRTDSTEDGRRKVVTLTSSGKKLVGPAMAAARRASNRILSVLEPAERVVFLGLLLKVVMALNEESSTPVESPLPREDSSTKRGRRRMRDTRN